MPVLIGTGAPVVAGQQTAVLGEMPEILRGHKTRLGNRNRRDQFLSGPLPLSSTQRRSEASTSVRAMMA
jgi:hypothetical protein